MTYIFGYYEYDYLLSVDGLKRSTQLLKNFGTSLNFCKSTRHVNRLWTVIDYNS